MPTYKITITLDNATFEEADGHQGMEISNILSKIALICREQGLATELRLQDTNGNYCGEAQVLDD